MPSPNSAPKKGAVSDQPCVTHGTAVKFMGTRGDGKPQCRGM